MNRRTQSVMPSTLALSILWMISQTSSAGTLYPIAVSGQPVPDGNGVYSGQGNINGFRPPTLNNRGVVCFHAGVIESVGSAQGIFCGIPTVVSQAARSNQAPSVLAGEVFESFTNASPAINDAGGVAFLSSISGTSTQTGIFRKGPTAEGYTLFTRTGTPSPVEGLLAPDRQRLAALNPSGRVAFYAVLTGTNGGTADDTAIFRNNSDGNALVQIAQEGDPVPGGNGALVPFNATPAMNGGGDVAFCASISGIPGQLEAIVRGNGSSLTLIARTGTLVPGFLPIRDFWTTTQVSINDSGVVAFVAETTYSAGFEHLILKGDGTGSLEVVSPPGLSIPGTGRKFGGPSNHVCLNNAGQVGFVASTTAAGTGDQQGLFRDQTLVALEEEAVPGGGATFRSLQGSFALNESGQMAFKAWLTITGNGTGYGIYFWDEDGGLQEIARYGDSFLGSSITGLDFAGTSTNLVLPPGMNGLNNAGEVAFKFELADGREGIALWSSLPKPASGGGQIHPVAGGFQVRFPGIPGWDYVMERDEDLLPPWERIPTPVKTGADGWITFDDLGPGLPPKRFYRCAEAP